MILSRSSLVLVIANAAPLVGVALFDWHVLDILMLYGAESAVVGGFNVLRMIKSQPENLLSGFFLRSLRLKPSDIGDTEPPDRPFQILKLFLIVFFVAHYGAFCIAYLSLVPTLFVNSLEGAAAQNFNRTFQQPDYWVAIAGLIASHGYSFFTNYLGKNEYRNIGLIALMFRPYGRVLLMNITVVTVGVIVLWLGNPLGALIVLVLLKVSVDLRLHLRERVMLKG